MPACDEDLKRLTMIVYELSDHVEELEKQVKQLKAEARAKSKAQVDGTLVMNSPEPKETKE